MSVRLPVVEPDQYTSAMVDGEVRREVWLAEVARQKLAVAQYLEEGDVDMASRELREKGEEIAAGIEHTKPNERERDFAYVVADNMYF